MYPSCLQSISVDVPANVTIKFAFSHCRQTHVVIQPSALTRVCIIAHISSLRSYTNTFVQCNLPSRRRGTSNPCGWTVVISTASCPSHNMSCHNMFPLIRCIHRRSKTLPHLQVRDVGDVRQSRKVSCNRPADASNGGFPFVTIVSLVVRC